MPVVLLVHCDGTNGSTTFTDASPSGHTLSATTVTVSTTNPKFGTGSALYGSAITVTGGATSDWNFGAGQFTLEAQAFFTSAPGTVIVLGQMQGSTNLGWDFGTNGGSLLFYYSTTGTDSPSVGAVFSPTLNQWYHLAVDRDASNVLRVYVNGTVLASATVSATFFASTRQLVIGNDGNATRAFPGKLDEIRITKGTAQYGGAFTPPTAPFNGVVSAQARAMIFA